MTQTTKKNTNYRGAAHPMSDEMRRQAQAKLKQLYPKGKPRFGDKRDAYLASLKTKEPMQNPCTSRGLSTMPSRKAA